MSGEWAGVIAALVIAVIIAAVIAWFWVVWVVVGLALAYFGIENIIVQVFVWIVVNAILGKLSR